MVVYIFEETETVSKKENPNLIISVYVMGVEQDPELGVQAEKPPNPHQHGWRKRKPRRATERYLEYLQNWANVLIRLIALPDGLRYREMRVSLTYEVARGACCPCQRAGRQFP